jgi:hypothetical protein
MPFFGTNLPVDGFHSRIAGITRGAELRLGLSAETAAGAIPQSNITSARINAVFFIADLFIKYLFTPLLIQHGSFGADRGNVSVYSKKSIREHYESEPVWQICGDLWDAQSRAENQLAQ